MPIYEYVCRNCGNELERLQKLSDASLTDCPECGESALKRKVSAAGFRLSGSGWYETDFKSDGRRNIAGDKGSKGNNGDGKSGDAKSGDGKSGDGKSDGKAKAKPADKPGKSTQSTATGADSA